MTMQKAAERAAELANAAEGRTDWEASDFLPENASADMTAFVQFIADADAAAREISTMEMSPLASYAVGKALSPFILPDDVDPLEQAIAAIRAGEMYRDNRTLADDLRTALASRGLQIVEQGK